MTTLSKAKGFTGWHMLSIMLAFFGTIITVNVTMAVFANTSWSGMVSKNTYVASQDFNKNAARARAWAAAGFDGEIVVEGARLRYRLKGPAKVIAEIDGIRATFHRPVGEKQDFTVQLVRQGDWYVTPDALDASLWIANLAATRKGEVIFHKAQRIVSEGQ